MSQKTGTIHKAQRGSRMDSGKPAVKLQGFFTGFPWLTCWRLDPKPIKESAWVRTVLDPWTSVLYIKSAATVFLAADLIYFGRGSIFIWNGLSVHISMQINMSALC